MEQNKPDFEECTASFVNLLMNRHLSAKEVNVTNEQKDGRTVYRINITCAFVDDDQQEVNQNAKHIIDFEKHVRLSMDIRTSTNVGLWTVITRNPTCGIEDYENVLSGLRTEGLGDTDKYCYIFDYVRGLKNGGDSQDKEHNIKCSVTTVPVATNSITKQTRNGTLIDVTYNGVPMCTFAKTAASDGECYTVVWYNPLFPAIVGVQNIEDDSDDENVQWAEDVMALHEKFSKSAKPYLRYDEVNTAIALFTGTWLTVSHKDIYYLTNEEMDTIVNDRGLFYQQSESM